MTEYVPTTEEVRSLYKSGAWLMTDRAPNKFDQGEYEGVLFGEFDHWLNEIRAEAWDEGLHRGVSAHCEKDCDPKYDKQFNPYRPNEK